LLHQIEQAQPVGGNRLVLATRPRGPGTVPTIVTSVTLATIATDVTIVTLATTATTATTATSVTTVTEGAGYWCLVADVVHQARETVHGHEMPPVPAGQGTQGDGKVFASHARGERIDRGLRNLRCRCLARTRTLTGGHRCGIAVGNGPMAHWRRLARHGFYCGTLLKLMQIMT